MEAFIYRWTDHKKNMFYVGSHKGPKDDGYVCSSKLMLEQYKERPKDFSRHIIAEGANWAGNYSRSRLIIFSDMFVY
jgi:hypothetical protein